MGKAIRLFYAEEFLFKPSNLISWIRPLIEEPPVQVVASLHVDANHCSLWVEWEWFRVVSPLTEDFLFGSRKPIGTSPTIFEVVDWPVSIWSLKFLDIDRPSVMITLNWEDLDTVISCLLFP